MNYRFLLMLLVAVTASATLEDDWKSLCGKGQQVAMAKEYARAESIYADALHMADLFGKNDTRVAFTEQAVAQVFRRDGKLSEAEEALQRAVTIYMVKPGDDSMEYALAQLDLAAVLIEEKKYQPALQSLNLLLPVLDARLNPNDYKISDALCLQGDAYVMLKRYASAETPLKRCAEIQSEDGAVDTPQFGEATHNLAIVYQHLGNTAEADRYFVYAAKIREQVLGIQSQELADTLEAHALLLHQMGREPEAKQKERLAAAIRAHGGKK